MGYIKLNEVELIENSVEPNLLIEDNGDIKRIPASNIATPKTQSDWNETDPTKESFIKNKPESLGGSKVVTYTFDSNRLVLDGVTVDAQQVLDEWNAGTIIRLAISDTEESSVLNIYYDMVSGALSQLAVRYVASTGVIVQKDISV